MNEFGVHLDDELLGLLVPLALVDEDDPLPLTDHAIEDSLLQVFGEWPVDRTPQIIQSGLLRSIGELVGVDTEKLGMLDPEGADADALDFKPFPTTNKLSICVATNAVLLAPHRDLGVDQALTTGNTTRPGTCLGGLSPPLEAAVLAAEVSLKKTTVPEPVLVLRVDEVTFTEDRLQIEVDRPFLLELLGPGELVVLGSLAPLRAHQLRGVDDVLWAPLIGVQIPLCQEVTLDGAEDYPVDLLGLQEALELAIRSLWSGPSYYHGHEPPWPLGLG